MHKFINLFLPLVFVFFIGIAAAQPSDPYEEDPDANVPLDEGLLTVLISGAAIGVSKLIKKK